MKQHQIISMFRISELKIYNIGSFGRLTLEFKRPKELKNKAEIHILTGENGTGKTTILEIMAALIQPDNFKNIAPKRRSTKEYSLSLVLNKETIEIAEHPLNLHKTLGKTSPLVTNRYWKPYDNPNLPFSIAFFAYSGHRRFEHKKIDGVKEIEAHPFEHALDFQQSIQSENILQWIVNNKSKSALAQVDGNIAEADQFRFNIDKLETTVSEIIQKQIKLSIERNPFKVIIIVGGEKLEFNQLPDGLKSIISWIADLLMRMDRVKWENDTPVFERNFILFLDEIEVHMHPVWQRKILPVVQKLFPNAQIFISTHSPFVVGSVDGACIHKLVKPNGDSKLAEGYPILSEDEKSYEYWLEEVFGIHEKYGLVAQDKYERRRELIRRQELTPSEQDELKQLDEQFGTLLPEDSSLGQRIVEHLKKLKNEKAAS
ncbi:AAA family ATPase [Haliscomenobacter sp.]|uniref:AAA family ATPase n=1 Tax=Haliscomenobacter sp. TaxID=2717303 RepID=UPI0035932093